VCVCVCVGVWVCDHHNSKLRASILTKQGLWVKIVTISSWLNFGGPALPWRGSAAGENFWLCLTTASAQCLRLLWALFFIYSAVFRRTMFYCNVYRNTACEGQLKTSRNLCGRAKQRQKWSGMTAMSFVLRVRRVLARATAAAAAAGGGAGVECASIHRVHHSSTSSVNCADDVIRYSRWISLTVCKQNKL